MSDYNSMIIARSEHQNTINSMPTVSEFGCNVRDAEPGWASRQGRRLLDVVGGGLFAASELLKHGSDKILETPITERDHSSAAG